MNLDTVLTEIEVKNFGPLIDCSLKIKPLTVFVGPSNTGKSVLAILLYALHRQFSDSHRWIRSLPTDLRWSIRQIYGDKAMKTEEQLLASLISATKTALDESAEPKSPIRLTVPPRVVETLKNIFEKESLNIEGAIEYCFGTPIRQLIRHRSRKESSIKINTQTVEENMEFSFKYLLRNGQILSESSNEVSIFIEDPEEIWELQTALRMTVGKELDNKELSHRDHPFWRICDLIYRILISRWIGSLSSRAFYLPADRTGIMHAHSTLVSSLIERAPLAGLRREFDTPLLTGVLADFLDRLITKKRSLYLRSARGRSSSTVDSKAVKRLGSDLENIVLGGKISEERDELTNYPEFRYKPIHWKNSIPLSNSSSMVSELASVVLYLRNHVKPDDFLIIEEPESHLHPAKQVEFMRFLACLVNLDVKVVLTTHSEWIIEEIGNIVQRAQYDKSFKESHSSDFSTAIPAHDVGVWLFRHRLRNNESIGSVVREVHIDETGLYPTEYESVAEQLHNEWASLVNNTASSK